jgi:hypothetical protein
MERASRKKYHYIYKTTCIITNKFYIGMHSTDNLEDGYIGSGKRLWNSINKHGKDNHVCEILEFLLDRSSLKAREKEIVNVELINEELCMNLQLGGDGGFISEEQQRNRSLAGGKAFSNKIKNDSIFYKEFADIQRIKFKKLHSESKFKYNNFEGKSHSKETKVKIGAANSIKQKGSNNSQYGKCWITNEIESKKINKGDVLPEGWRLGRKII